MEAVVMLDSGCALGTADGSLREKEIMEGNMAHYPKSV
jgi:hypothetical protein